MKNYEVIFNTGSDEAIYIKTEDASNFIVQDPVIL